MSDNSYRLSAIGYRPSTDTGRGSRVQVAGKAALRWLALVLLFTAFPPSRLPALYAQSDPRLVDAVRMAAAGPEQGDSARAMVDRLLMTTSVSDSLYPQLLYTKGMIAADAAERQRAFQRVIVEFGNSGWADKALFRLAQVEYAAGNPQGALKYLERIRSDYPDSPVTGEAAYWAARIYQESNDLANSCRWVQVGLDHANGDIELGNRLNFFQGRCQSYRDSVSATAAAPAPQPSQPAPTPTETPAPSPSRPSAPAPAPAAHGRYQVQVAAVTNQATADLVAGQVRKLGYTADIVREKGFLKVRAGGFATRAEAQDAAIALKRRMGGSPFVVAAP